MMVPALQQATDAVIRTQAQVAGALPCSMPFAGINKPANSASPIELEKLGLPADATIDPFNGEPLHVKKSAGRLDRLFRRQRH